MSFWRVSTNYGDRYTRADSVKRARANVAYNLRKYGAFIPHGSAAAWVAVVVPLTKPQAERAKKMKYYANYTTNNGSTYNSSPFEYANKREAIRSIREIARGETFAGNRGNVSVSDERGKTVYEGVV